MTEDQPTMRVDMGSGKQARMPVNYPANSRRSKEPQPEKEVKKVIEGVAVQRKKSWVDRTAHTIFAEDSSTVMSYIVMEVLVPAFRNLIFDTISQGAERVLYGESRRSSRSSGTYTNYSKMADRGGHREALSRHARATHDFEDIMLSSRIEADEVLDSLRELIDRFEAATVADLYDLVGLTGSFSDNQWGWRDLRNASVRPVRGGYLLNLPRTVSIS